MMATERLKENNLPCMEDLLKGLGADWQVYIFIVFMNNTHRIHMSVVT